MQQSRARKIIDRYGARSLLRILVEKHGISLDRISEIMIVKKKQLIRYLDGDSNIPAHRVDNLLAGIDGIKP